MNAGETKLQPVLEGTKQYVVPLFQRSYSWKEKDWTILWDDIAELCQDSNPRNHFIGSIVTMPASSVPQGISKFLLIDGQQRLTTIFILLALLRDTAKQTGQEDLAQEIEFTLLVNQFKRDFEYYKLLPSQGDRASFHNIIRSESTTAEDRITDAYHFFERKLRRDGIDIQTLMKVIANNLSLVSIVLDPDDNPYLVFESLNAKGEPLTQGDLIRNFVFMRVHVDEQDRVYSQYWKPMQDALNDDLTEFIRHYLMKGGANVKQSDVYFSLKEIVGQGDTLEYLKDLTQFAKYYEKLLHPEKEENNDIRQALYRINRLEVTTGYPFLLNCYHDYDRNNISASQFVDVLKTIENYIVRRFVCNIATKSLNTLETKFVDILHCRY